MFFLIFCWPQSSIDIDESTFQLAAKTSETLSTALLNPKIPKNTIHIRDVNDVRDQTIFEIPVFFKILEIHTIILDPLF